ncbi:hypothetical protein FHR92_004105 [Fontibacillus solani]|uniref:Uncharacterized protein n=1 Tax=Fontibacillus solani TaxID=1572857 RepID=A0A7W3XTH9_9BACL|nr:hypothetical protein [Fontibacillus solani]MBA9087620.1 hypothetical protein [Fontibacillus solani]
MSGQENYELDIEINSRDIDETEKKLSRLDKMLQQTQKRFDALGKKEVKPKVIHNDRLIPTVSKFRDSLFGLDRKIINPMASLKKTKYESRLFSDSMQVHQVSSQLSPQLNELGLGLSTGMSKIGFLSTNNNSDADEKKNKDSSDKNFLESYLNSMKSVLSDLTQDAGKAVAEHQLNNIGNIWKESNVREKWNASSVKKMIDNFNTSKSMKFLNSLIKDVKPMVALDVGIGAYEFATAETGREKAKAAGSTIGGIAGGTVGALFGGGFLSFFVGSLGGIVGSKLGEAAGGHIYDIVYDKDTQMAYEFGIKNGAYDSIYGGKFVSSLLKFFVFDRESNMDQVKEQVNDIKNGFEIYLKSGIMKDTVPGGNLLNSLLNYMIFGKETNNDTQLGSTNFNENEVPQSNFPIVEWGAITNGTVRPNIYVTLPEGAVNMTVNKEENIDYEELVSLVGWHVANAVRYAEQNLK